LYNKLLLGSSIDVIKASSKEKAQGPTGGRRLAVVVVEGRVSEKRHKREVKIRLTCPCSEDASWVCVLSEQEAESRKLASFVK